MTLVRLQLRSCTLNRIPITMASVISSTTTTSPSTSPIPSPTQQTPGARRPSVDLSPAPIQHFHKSKVHGPHLTGTHLLSGVSGAAHFSSSTSGQTNLQSPPLDAAAAATRRHRHSSSMSSSSHSASTIVLEGKRKQILEDVLELFCSRPTIEIFQRSWSPDAMFEDPLSQCIGYPEYAPQWFGMPKLFPKSVTLNYKEYTIKGIGTKKVMKSTVVIELDDQDRIIKLDDKWDGKDHPVRWGALLFRRLNAKTLPWLVSVPKLDKSE